MKSIEVVAAVIFDEQQRIVAIIEELFELIDKITK